MSAFRKQLQLSLLATLASAIILGNLSCSITKSSKSKRRPGTWQAQPVTIDGYNNDWPAPYPEYDDKAMLGYAVSNDKENLYITVETGDPATQLKILHSGLTVWIDKAGERNAITAINFPLPDAYKAKKSDDEKRANEMNVGQVSTPEKQRYALEDRVKRAFQFADEYSLQGFKGCNRQFNIVENDSCGIVVRMAIDSTNELIWEAVVPLKAFYYKAAISAADKGKPLSICIETTGLKRPAGQKAARQTGRGNFTPSIGFGGMGMRMGGMGMSSISANGGMQQQEVNILESLYKDTKTIKFFGLAWQN